MLPRRRPAVLADGKRNLLIIYNADNARDCGIMERLRDEYLNANYRLSSVHDPAWVEGKLAADLSKVWRILVILSPAFFHDARCVRLLQGMTRRATGTTARRNLSKLVVIETERTDSTSIKATFSESFDRLQRIHFYDPNAPALPLDDPRFERGLLLLRSAIESEDVKFGFISYSRHQKTWAEQLKAQFDAAHESVWVDISNIPPARDFLAEIQHGILSSRYFFFLMTPEAIVSPYCKAEFDHAQSLRKRIIPLRLQPQPPAAVTIEVEHARLLEALKRRIEASPNEQPMSFETAQAFYADLLAHHPLWLELDEDEEITGTHLTQIIEYAKWQNERDDSYAESHTQYLIWADAWKQKQRGVLVGHELAEAQQWRKERDAKQRAAPTTEGEYVPYALTASQREFFSASTRAWWFRRLIIPSVVILIAAIAAIIYRQDANTRLATQQALAAQAERVQTQAQLNRRVIVPIGASPRAAILSATDLWVMTSDGQFTSMALNGSETSNTLPISVGLQPSRGVWRAPYLWLVSRTADGKAQFVRVDTRDRAVATFPIDLEAADLVRLLTPHLAGDVIWLLPNPRTLIALPADADSVDQMRHIPINDDLFGLSPSQPISIIESPDALWLAIHEQDSLFPQEERVLRVDGACVRADQPSCVTVTPIPGLLHVADDLYRGSLWVATSTDLIRLNADGSSGGTQPLRYPLQLLQANAEGVWAVARDEDGTVVLNLDALTGAIRGEQRVSGTINELHLVGEHAYLYGADETLTILAPLARESLLSTRLTGLNRAPAPLLAGDLVWVVTSTSNSVTVIVRRSGQILRNLPVCENPIEPIFDGANVWLLCDGVASAQQSVIALPNNLLYIGEDRAVLDDYRHAPIFLEEALWLLQEDNGQVVRVQIDTNQQIMSSAALSLPPISGSATNWNPLLTDNTYLWTAFDNPGVIVRLTPASALTTPRVNCPDTPYAQLPTNVPVSAIDCVTIGDEIQGMEWIDGRLWLWHSNMQALNDPTMNLTVIDPTTMAVNEVRLGGIGTVISGVDQIDDQVWAGVGTIAAGSLYRLDPVTLRSELIETPLPNFVPFAGFAYADRYWFNFGSSSFFDALGGLAGTEIAAPTVRDSYLIPYDPAMEAWGGAVTLPGFTYRPIIDTYPPNRPDGSLRLWYTLSLQPLSLVESVVTNNAINRVYALDLPSGVSVVEREMACPSIVDLGIFGNYVWYGCLSRDDVYAFPRDGGEPHVFSKLGRAPSTPLLLDGVLYLTFLESGTAALFDVNDAVLLRRTRIGVSPTAPVEYMHGIWLYNSSDGTLQRLHVP